MSDPCEPNPRNEVSVMLAGGGEMGERVRAHDWNATPLGPVETWSPALTMIVRTILANRLPMLLWWGPQYVSIYNDAYGPVLGNKHPWALGQPVSECWKEIWPVLKPLIDAPFHGGPSTWNEDILLEINRHGFNEETHWLIAYSPVPDDSVTSGIGGVLATVHETTDKVLGERRMVALRDLAIRPAEAKTAIEACVVAVRALESHDADVPFALLYLLDPSGKQARLAAATTSSQQKSFCPSTIEVGKDTVWPILEAAQSMQQQILPLLGDRFDDLPTGRWPEPPNTAVVLPLRSIKANEAIGFFIVGVSSRLRCDEAYLRFLDLAASQIATAVSNARAFEEEKRRAETLAELDRAKTVFFSNVSHEFRTPLALMIGPVEEMLARSFRELSPAAKEQLEIVKRNGQRLLRLVNTLLDFSRIEAGRMTATYQPTDLAAFTIDLASVFRAAIERAGLRLIVNCPKLSDPIFVDPEMWEKIVLNLLSNALKFTFEGEIEVTLRQTGQSAELQIRDTGTGIPPEEMPHIFERFHRVEAAKGRTREGSGIGLALVQELVKLHGGTVAAQSELGTGTTFTLTIPIRSDHLPQDQMSTELIFASSSSSAFSYFDEALGWLPDESDESKKSEPTHFGEPLQPPYHERTNDENRDHVLVADDNVDMRQYIARLLSERFFVEAVADGEAALAKIKANRPNLVLTDVMMPKLDGFGLLKALRYDPETRDIPVIMLSARAGEESRVEGMEAGADDYLVKPFSAKELLASVGAHLMTSRIRREASEALREREAWLVGQKDALQAAVNGAPLEVSLDVLVHTCLEQLGNDSRAAFYLANAEGTRLHHIVGMSKLYSVCVEGFKISEDSLACGLAMHSQHPVITPDVTLEPRWKQWLWLAETFEFRGIWSFPILTAEGRVVGTFAVYLREPREPTSREIMLVGVLTQAAAMIIARQKVVEERDRAEKTVRTSEERQAFLLKLSDSLRPLGDPLAIQQLSGRLLGEKLAVDRAAYGEADPTGDFVNVTHEWIRPGASSVLGNYRIDDFGKFFTAPLRQGKPSIMEDAASDPRVSREMYAASWKSIGVRSAIAYPLVKDERLVALIFVHVSSPRKWRESEITLLSEVGERTWAAVEQAKAETALLDAKHQVAIELEAMNRLHALSTRIMSINNLIAGLDDLLENAMAACAADFGNIQLYNSESKALEIVAHRGYQQSFLNYFRRVSFDDETACSRAMTMGERVVIEDVTLDPRYARHTQIAAETGYRSVQSTPLLSSNGEVRGMLSTHFRDPHRPTARDGRLLDLYARLAADLIDRVNSERTLKEAAEKKDEFLATLAHELRNPLAPLRNGLQMMKLATNDVSAVEHARAMMERQLGQMIRLIDDLMDLTRISRGKIVLQKHRMPLTAAIRNAVEASRPLIDAAGHDFTLNMPDEVIYVDADEVRLSQVITNLLNNAAKYTQNGGHIRLKVERQGSDAIICVEDNGVGIPAHMLPKVFEMFTQVDRNLEKSQGGLGIGLSIVKQLIEMHGGTIEAKSGGHGMGSTFVVRIPIVLSLAETHRVEQPMVAPQPTTRRRILVVDDNRDAAISLAMMLEIMGNSTQSAHDGLEAVELAAAFRPDVILLDIGMPKLNGYDACRRIREQSWGKNVYIVACTGWGQDQDKHKARDAGFNSHMTKPVDPGSLEKLLNDLKTTTG